MADVDRCLLAVIGYLFRNDFSNIQRLSGRTIKASDGTRQVYIWVSINEHMSDEAAVPEELCMKAAKAKARLDVVKIDTDGDRASIEHMLNIPVRP